MRTGTAPAVAVMVAGAVVVAAGVALAVAPARGTADAGALAPSPAVPSVPASPPRPEPATPVGGGPEPPEVLALPALGVRATVVDAPVTAGALAVPADPTRVGWWPGGALPGADTGSVVLAGHVDTR